MHIQTIRSNSAHPSRETPTSQMAPLRMRTFPGGDYTPAPRAPTTSHTTMMQYYDAIL